jgi:hypothetical protein
MLALAQVIDDSILRSYCVWYTKSN